MNLKTKYFLLCTGVVLTLSGCQSTVKNNEQDASIDPTTASTELPPTEDSDSQLTPELLYDLLVASIASQRQQPEIALESLSRAAYQSRDRRLIAEAIRLAMDAREYQQAAELAQLLNSMEPENHRATLALAEAQFNLGESDLALKMLSDLAKTQTREQIDVMQDIANVLSRQNEDTILSNFLDIVLTEPENTGLGMTATLLASRLEDSEQFLRLVDQVLTSNPDWEMPALMKLSHLSGQNSEPAVLFANTHLKDYPRHNRFRLQYARTLIQQDELDAALSQLLKILKANPKSIQALYSAGIIYIQQEKLDKAKHYLARYLDIDNRNDQVRIYLADISFEQQNYDEAIKYLQGVSSYQHYFDAQIKLGRVLAKRTGVEAGIRHLQKVEAANEEERVQLILEQDILFRDNKMNERAKQILDNGLARFPDNPDLLYNRGLLAAQLGLIELHETDLRKLIAIQPDNAHAYNSLGYTLADKTDRLDEALSLISKANELLPNNAFILDSMGWIHFRMGNNEQALEFLNKALVERQDAEIAAHLGEVLWSLGNHNEALKIWEQGSEWGPNNEVLKETIERLSRQQPSTYQFRNTISPYPVPA